MSTEQNTQRPDEWAEGAKIAEECRQLAQKQPPPETGVVDVGVIASSFMKHLDHAPDLREMFAQGMQPLTQRISQLEQEKFTIWSQQQAAEARVNELEQTLKESSARDGDWLDKWGACRICDGEIPHGHTNNCHIYKQEQRIRELEQKLEAALQVYKDAQKQPLAQSESLALKWMNQALNLRAQLAAASEDSRRLEAVVRLIWETRWASEDEEYQKLVGIAAAMRSGNYKGIDLAMAQQKGGG